MEWEDIPIPEYTYNSQTKEYSYNIGLSKYKELEIILWIKDWTSFIDERVVVLDKTYDRSYVYTYYDGTWINSCRVTYNKNFIVVQNVTTNMQANNVILLMGLKAR